MDYKDQLRKEKMLEEILSKGRQPTEAEKAALEHIGQEGKWYDKLSTSEKSKYRKLPDMSDADALHKMNEVSSKAELPSDSLGSNSKRKDSSLKSILKERMQLDNLKSSMTPDDELESIIKKSGSMEFPKEKDIGSRMASKLELDKIGRSRMADSVEMGALKRIAGKFGSGIGKKAAGLAIGGPLALASEMADASEIGISPRDQIIESTEYTPEQKKALLRGLDMKMKLRGESGDVSQDPTVLKAREIGNRLQDEAISNMTEDKATDNAMRRISPEDQAKILRDIREYNRRK